MFNINAISHPHNIYCKTISLAAISFDTHVPSSGHYVSPIYFFPQSNGMLYMQSFVPCISIFGSVFVSMLRSAVPGLNADVAVRVSSSFLKLSSFVLKGVGILFRHLSIPYLAGLLCG
jgi:hypothetical protein